MSLCILSELHPKTYQKGQSHHNCSFQCQLVSLQQPSQWKDKEVESLLFLAQQHLSDFSDVKSWLFKTGSRSCDREAWHRSISLLYHQRSLQRARPFLLPNDVCWINRSLNRCNLPPKGSQSHSVYNKGHELLTRTKSRLCLSPQCKLGVIGVTSTKPTAWYVTHLGAYFCAALDVFLDRSKTRSFRDWGNSGREFVVSSDPKSWCAPQTAEKLFFLKSWSLDNVTFVTWKRQPTLVDHNTSHVILVDTELTINSFAKLSRRPADRAGQHWGGGCWHWHWDTMYIGLWNSESEQPRRKTNSLLVTADEILRECPSKP